MCTLLGLWAYSVLPNELKVSFALGYFSNT